MFDFKLTKQNLLKWSVGLGILLLICFMFPFANLIHDGSKALSLSGYDILFGTKFDTAIHNQTQLTSSLIMSIGFFGFVFFCLLSFINLKKVDFIKKLLTIIFGSVLLITLLTYSTRYSCYTTNYVDFEFNLFGKFVVFLIGALIIDAIVVYYKTTNENEFKQENIDIITVALSCLILISLFEPFGLIKNTSYTIELKGLAAMFGETLEAKAFTLSSIPSNIYALIGYIMLGLLIVIGIVNTFVKNKYTRLISLFISSFVFVFFANIDVICLNITQVSYSSTVYKSLTELGVVCGLLAFIVFIINCVYHAKNYTRPQLLKVAMYLCAFLAFSSIYIPAYKLYKQYTSSTNYITNISIIDILDGSVKLNANYTYTTTYPSKLILGLILGFSGLICLLIPLKQEKIKYICSSGLLIASALIILFAKDTLLKQIVQEVSSYDKFIYINGGYIVIGCLLICAFIALYLGATAKEIKFVKTSKFKKK